MQLLVVSLFTLALAGLLIPGRGNGPSQPAWEVHHVSDLSVRQRESGRDYLEFLRVPELSAGVYRLRAGGEDRQSPHASDEVYYVLEGRADFWADGDSRPVRTGSVIFVGAGVEHRFQNIEEDLTLLVVFGRNAKSSE